MKQDSFTLAQWVCVVCIRESEEKQRKEKVHLVTFHTRTSTSDLCCNSCGFQPFLHTSPKPLTTNLCGVPGTSCWKPGSCWPPVKEDPLHHGGDTLTVQLSLSEEGPLPPHTHFLLWWLKDKHNDTNCSQSLSFLTQVQLWMCALVHPTQIFTQWHSHKLSLNPSSHTPHSRYMANKTILLLIPTFTHTHTHKHTWIHTLELDHYALMYSGLSLQVTWPLLSCLSEGEEPIQPDGSRSEWLWTTGRVNM